MRILLLFLMVGFAHPVVCFAGDKEESQDEQPDPRQTSFSELWRLRNAARTSVQRAVSWALVPNVCTWFIPIPGITTALTLVEGAALWAYVRLFVRSRFTPSHARAINLSLAARAYIQVHATSGSFPDGFVLEPANVPTLPSRSSEPSNRFRELCIYVRHRATSVSRRADAILMEQLGANVADLSQLADAFERLYAEAKARGEDMPECEDLLEAAQHILTMPAEQLMAISR